MILSYSFQTTSALSVMSDCVQVMVQVMGQEVVGADPHSTMIPNAHVHLDTDFVRVDDF